MNKEVFDFIARTAEDFDIEVRDEDGSICLELGNDIEYFIEYDTKEDCTEEFEGFDDNLYDYINGLGSDLCTYQFDSIQERVEIYGTLEVLKEFRDRLVNDFEYDFA